MLFELILKENIVSVSHCKHQKINYSKKEQATLIMLKRFNHYHNKLVSIVLEASKLGRNRKSICVKFKIFSNGLNCNE